MPAGAEPKRKESMEKVTGIARYNGDFCMAGAARAVLVTSPHAHARIVSIDTREALLVPGVLAVLTGKDVAGILTGPVILDRPILADGKVRYCGEPVALVVAEDEHAAAKAALLVQAAYEPLPSVTSAREAVIPGAPLVHEGLGSYKKEIEDVYPEPGSNVAARVKIRKGNMRYGWAKSAVVVEGSFICPQADHIAMETRSAWARIIPGGRVEIHTCSQVPFEVRKMLSKAFYIEEGLIDVYTPLVGGAYGGKTSVQLEYLACAASRAIGGRAVYIANTREQDIATSPCRIGSESTLKIGVALNGTIMAAEMTYLLDCGAYADICPKIASAVAVDCSGPYNIPNLQCDALCVYTNHTYATAYRGFGHITAAFCIERMMDKTAAKLNMDPLRFREINALSPGNTSPTQVSLSLHNSGDMKACLGKLKESIRWDEGRIVDLKNGKVRAKGLAGVFKTSNSPTGAVSGAIVTFNRDGSMNLSVGAVEIGAGMKTAAAQILAEAMGTDLSRVHVDMEVHTKLNPTHWKTVASMTTFMMGAAIRRAAQDAKEQLFKIASAAMRFPVEDLALKNERVYLRDDPEQYMEVKDLAHGYQYPDGMGFGGEVIGRGSYIMRQLTVLDKETGKGRPGPYWTLGAQAVEVEYDKNDHTYRLLKAATVLDAGRILNPKNADALVRGAMAMGLSAGTRECFRYGPDGGTKNTSLRSYKVMHYGEQPEYAVDFIETQHETRGLAEHGIIGMPAAVANALSAAAGVEIDQFPATPELIFRLAGGHA